MTIQHTVALPGWTHLSSGKVRDLYIPEGENQDSATQVLVVATDRISAFDYVLPTQIPGKGIVLTQLSLWWFEQLSSFIPNHVLSTQVPEQVAGRAMICRRLDMYPVECVARGYLTGSGLAQYRSSNTVCEVKLPPGLVEASYLPETIFTPAAKAEVGQHDENISFEHMVNMVGKDTAQALRDATIALYNRARDIARDQGIILADTKFEFGSAQMNGGPEIVLGDEVLTPDSSRFWPADQWEPGRVTPSFDKQYVRDWLMSPQSGWDHRSEPPALPQAVVARTHERYVEAYEMLTGRTINF